MTTGRRLGTCIVLVAAGCTTGAETFAQDLAYQRWKRCDTFATVVIQRINTDGGVIVTGRETEQYPFLHCMADQLREQRKSRPGLVAPDPTFNPLPR